MSKETPFDYGKKLPDGQNERHPVLPPADDSQLVRPLRNRYRHVGIRPSGPTRKLTSIEERAYAGEDYECFEPYDPPRGACTGRFWTKRQLESGCNQVTVVGAARGISQDALAKLLGCSPALVSRLESGQRGATVARLEDLAVAFSCAPEIIIALAGDVPPEQERCQSVVRALIVQPEVAAIAALLDKGLEALR